MRTRNGEYRTPTWPPSAAKLRRSAALAFAAVVGVTPLLRQTRVSASMADAAPVTPETMSTVDGFTWRRPTNIAAAAIIAMASSQTIV